jgi:hypothetical protein
LIKRTLVLEQEMFLHTRGRGLQSANQKDQIDHAGSFSQLPRGALHLVHRLYWPGTSTPLHRSAL